MLCSTFTGVAGLNVAAIVVSIIGLLLIIVFVVIYKKRKIIGKNCKKNRGKPSKPLDL